MSNKLHNAVLKGFTTAVVFAAVYVFFLRPLVPVICVEKTVPVLSSFIEGQKPAAFYLKKTDSLALIVTVFLFFSFFLISRWRKISAFIVNFFREEDSAWNLAIFRIVFFAFVLCTFDQEKMVWFSQIPRDLIVPPTGWGFLSAYIVFDPYWVGLLSSLFIVLCTMALLGLYTQPAALLASVVGVYVLGIPQFLGKVDHNHHLIWFMLILGTSRCADVLSLDAVRKALQQADRGEKIADVPLLRAYALPLRFIWLLMGIIYFFPGFWKFVKSQWHWAFSDNLKNQMYDKWFELGGWTPAFRIDQHPALYKLCGLGTIIFELAFIFLIFIPSLRFVAVLMGLSFHNLTAMFMKITFYSLQVCYVSLINWAGLFRKAGITIFKNKLYVLYDGNCKLCRRTIAVLKRFDVLQNLEATNALDQRELDRLDLNWINPQELMKDMHVVAGGKKWAGYEAYQEIAKRMPVFWPILPLLWLPPVVNVGKLIYRKVADSRLCLIRSKIAMSTASPAKAQIPTFFITWVGSILVVLNIWCGLTHTLWAWPVACYPTFAGLAEEPRAEGITVYGIVQGQEMMLDIARLKDKFTRARFSRLTSYIVKVKDQARQTQMLQSLVVLLKHAGVPMNHVQTVRIYMTVRNTTPGHFGDEPLKKELLIEIEVKDT